MEEELIIGVSLTTGVELLFLKGNKVDGFSVDTTIARAQTASRVIPASGTPDDIVMTMQSGNIDYDPASEFAITINEYERGFLGGTSGHDASVAMYYVYDDAASGFTQLAGGFVETRISGTLHASQTASVALGDIDADGVDEVILGGLETLAADCESGDYVMTAYDDAAHGLTELASFLDTGPSGSCETNSNPRQVTFVHVNTLDIDGDQVAEIQINENIYQDFRDMAWQRIEQIPRNDFSHNSSNSGFALRKATTALAVGDAIGDSKDDIIFRMPRLNEIAVWGYEKQPDNSLLFKQKFSQAVSSFFTNSGTVDLDPRPLIIPVNVDDDSFIVEYAGEVEYNYVFSEPIIIAALAGPPCAPGIGQTTDACKTSYGTSTSSTVSAEAAVTLSASGHVGAKGGFELPIIKSGVEVEYEETVTASVTAAVSGSYTVTKSESFTTDALEDTVIVTTVPYDQYTYRVVSHPNPDAVGRSFIMSVPRSPRTFQVERSFYNANVIGDEHRIGSSVFQHSIGDTDSYPSLLQKNATLSQYGGFDNGPKDVDLTGERQATIDVSEEVGGAVTLAVGYERSLKVTGGNVMAGFSVGVEASATLGYSVGSSTTYQGTVGGVDPTSPDFDSNNLYSWGIYAYTQDNHESGQEFQVINYWVQ